METTTEKPTRQSYKAQFKESFAIVTPLMKEEWPDLDGDALAATEGDLDRAVALVAAHLESTKAAARRQISELVDLATAQEAHRERSNGAAKPNESGARLPPLDDVMAAIRRLELFATEEVKRVSSEVVPAARAQAQKSMWTSLLIALGLGLFLGMWLNRGRR
ncbi:MAG: hypothetical protein JNK04_21860, partial [Myxococcales bacterium]|nr:hypothetical protein [Myxococcales bacterium]